MSNFKYIFIGIITGALASYIFFHKDTVKSETSSVLPNKNQLNNEAGTRDTPTPPILDSEPHIYEKENSVKISSIDRTAVISALRYQYKNQLKDYFEFNAVPLEAKNKLLNDLVTHSEKQLLFDESVDDPHAHNTEISDSTAEALKIVRNANVYSIANSFLNYLEFSSHEITDNEKSNLVNLLQTYQVKNTSEVSKLRTINQVASGANQFSQAMISAFDDFINDMEKAWAGYNIEQSINNPTR